jgi:hypothetical protein
MDRRKAIAGAALAVTLLLGGSGVAAAGMEHDCTGGFGQHTSQMAREHGGIAAATAHHNTHHDPDLTVGEHQKLMREHCG